MIYYVIYTLLGISISGPQLILEEYYNITGFMITEYNCNIGYNSKDLLVVDLVKYFIRSIFFIQNY